MSATHSSNWDGAIAIKIIRCLFSNIFLAINTHC